jgi:hypothetical protein
MLRRPVIFATLALLAAVGLALHLTLNRPKPPPVAPAAPALPAFVPPAPSADAAGKLRPGVAAAITQAPGTAWEQRLALVRSLPADLGPDETSALLAALMEPCPPGGSAAVHSSYIHEIACRLQHQSAVRESFARALATLARDPRGDPTTRDYAIQHLRQVWDRADGDTVLRDSIVATFREFADLDPAIAASALLSLHLLVTAPAPGAAAAASSHYAVPDAELDPLLSAVFSQTAATGKLPARLTACRIAGERRLAGFRAQLMAQLQDPAEHAMVRMAAANALGSIADPDDLARLAAYDPGDDRVATALTHALRNHPASPAGP